MEWNKKIVLLSLLLLYGCNGTGGGGGAQTSQSNGGGDAGSGGGTNYGPFTSTISGNVKDTSGNPIAGATISVFLTSDHFNYTATTDANGNYTVTGLFVTPYGSYEVRAEKLGYAFLPSIPSGHGSVVKSDYMALFRTIIEMAAYPHAQSADANFTGMSAGEKRVSLAQTGQTVSYVAGDDASLQNGIAWPLTRFINNGDGTISDSLTGLTWLRDADCFSATDWSSSLAAINGLANGACGLSDGSSAGQWRMPNVAELESLIDVSASAPAIPTTAPFINIGSSYWSSTTYRGLTSNAWVIRFSDGRYINDSINNDKSTTNHSVWAVKSSSTAGAIQLPATGQFIVYAANDDASLLKGVSLPSPRFIDKNNGTVTDTVTGLVWLKKADCIHANWTNAIADIGALADGQCGLTDGSAAGQWRMPNRTEMLSIVDRAETNQSLRFNTIFYKDDGSVDQAAIFDTFKNGEFYWTSSTNASDITKAWTVYSCDFGVYEGAKSSAGYSLAVQ